MLTQLIKLSIECDGRYAQSHELQFLKDYLDSVDERLETYEKIKQKSDAIIEDWEQAKRNYPEDLFHQGTHDITDICRRDMIDALRCAAVSMLYNELDRLREGMLIWYQTIAKAFNYTKYCVVDYRLIQDVVKLYLDPAEMQMITPILQLEEAILSH